MHCRDDEGALEGLETVAAPKKKVPEDVVPWGALPPIAPRPLKRKTKPPAPELPV